MAGRSLTPRLCVMRIDRTTPPPALPAVRSFDNTELRNRLAGQLVGEPDLSELQQLARSRTDESAGSARRRRRGH
jgi:hypothetical protein